MTNTLKLISGEAKIKAAIKALEAKGKAYANDVHVLLCSVFAHVKEYKNTTLIGETLNRLHQVTNVRGASLWIITNTNVRFDKDRGMWLKPDKKPLKVDLDAMIATPFWEMEAVKKGNQPLYDMETRLVSLINAARRNLSEGKSKQPEGRVIELSTALIALAKKHKVSLDTLEEPVAAKPATIVPQAKTGTEG